MAGRQHTTPLLLEAGHADRLVRVPLDDRGFSEDDLQRLLFEHPTVLPVDEIEPVFGPLIPIARELPTPAGPIDVTYLSPGGWPTLVETKLWRNPEARRQAVAQIIDYASAVSHWSYSDFVAAVRQARSAPDNADPLAEAVRQQEEGFDETHFADAVARNLERGRFLLLIVGDGIHEGLEQLTTTVSRTPQLGFTLALVELALFRRSTKQEPLVVQPRVVARTREIIRAVVEVRRPEIAAADVLVSLLSDDGDPAARLPLTAEAFYEELRAHESPAVVADFQAVLGLVVEHAIEPVWREASVSLHHHEPSSGARFSAGSVYCRSGRVDMFYVPNYVRAAGLADAVAREYLEGVAALVPGARAHTWQKGDGHWGAIKVGQRHITIAELLPHKNKWLAAIDQFVSRIASATAALEGRTAT